MSERGAASRGALALLVLALVLGGWLRAWHVERDLPSDLETTTAPAQDAFWYLESAQARADGSGSEPLEAYDRPLWTLAARAWFALAGTGVASSHALGAACGTLEVLFLFLALRPLGGRAAGLGSLLLATSYLFAGLSRTPLIYTPIATGLTGIWALWTNGVPPDPGGDPGAPPDAGGTSRDAVTVARAFAQTLAAWALLGVLAFGFKSVALVLAPGLVLGHLARRDGSFPWRKATIALGLSVLLAAALLSLGPARDLAWSTWRATVYRLNLYRDDALLEAGPRAPLVVVQRLLVMPWTSGLGRLAPGLLGLGAIGAIVAVRARLAPRERGVLASAVGWILALAVTLSGLEYQPLRWFALVAPALAGLAGFGAARLLEPARTPKTRPRVARRALGLGAVAEAAVVLSLVSSVLLAAAGFVGGSLRAPERVGLCEAIALGMSLLFVLRSRGYAGSPGPQPAEFGPKIARVLAVALLGGTIAEVARSVASFGSAPSSLLEANAAVRAALGPTAVAAGPYSSVLFAGAVGRQRRRAPDLLGGVHAAESVEVARRQGYTHVLLDREQDVGGRFSEGLASAGARPTLLLALEVRGSAVLVFRFADALSRGYVPSPFEQACALEDAGDPQALGRFRALADARALLVARARALLGTRRVAEGRAILDLVPEGDPARRRLERGLDAGLANMLEDPSDGGVRRR